MKAVELVIRKLMGEYEFVIIPGFGALLSHQIPAAFDTHAGIFSPPSKKLAFNEYLKLDDGLLANSISREEGLSHQRAVDIVKDYSEVLRAELDRAGVAEIPGVGIFSKNIEGKLVFEPNTGSYFKDEWYGFEQVKASQLAVIAPASVKSVEVQEPVEVMETDEEITTPRTIRWTSWAAAAMLTGLIFGISFFLMNSRSGEVQSTLNPFREMFAKDEPTVEIAPVEAETVVEETVPALPVDSAISENALTNADSAIVKPAPAEVAAVKVDFTTQKFLVIAGTFKGTRQANILLEQLKAKGIQNAAIILPDQYSKKVKVAVSGFSTEKEAYQSAAELKSVTGEEGWVYKNR